MSLQPYWEDQSSTLHSRPSGRPAAVKPYAGNQDLAHGCWESHRCHWREANGWICRAGSETSLIECGIGSIQYIYAIKPSNFQDGFERKRNGIWWSSLGQVDRSHGIQISGRFVWK